MAVPARRIHPPAPARRPPRPGRAQAARPVVRSRPRRRLPFLLVALVVVGGMVMALVSMQALVAQRSFQVNELQQQAEDLTSDYERLRLQLAEVSMPDRIQAAAQKAGLVLHERVEVLEVPRSDGRRRALASDRGLAGVKAALGAGG